MAHEILKPEKWASAALGLLEGEHVLAGLVSKDSGDAFVGAKGDSVNIKRPSLLAGTVEALRAMDAPDYEGIKSESLKETSFAVKLDTHVYNAVDLTDAELSLDINQFGAQVLTPQVKSIATRVEYMLAQKFNGLSATPATGATTDIVRRTIVGMRKTLNKSDVPQSGRILVVGVDVEEHLLNDPLFIRADQSGSTSALASATLGNIAGFRVVVANILADDRMVAFHPSAYTLVTRAPQIPSGAVAGETTSYKGVALRSVKDYNSYTAKDRSFLSTFAGIGETVDPTITHTAAGVPTASTSQSMLRAVAATVSVVPEDVPSP